MGVRFVLRLFSVRLKRILDGVVCIVLFVGQAFYGCSLGAVG